LWNSWVGGEFLAEFTPDFQLQNNILLAGDKPQVNSYMVNAIASAPFGADNQFQPFISAGLGGITLRSNTLNAATDNPVNNTLAADDSRLGGNIGGGVMAFMGNWGVRADVRYFRAFNESDVDSSNPSSTANAAARAVLPGLDFWRANIGVAVRW